MTKIKSNNTLPANAHVISVSANTHHAVHKELQNSIELEAGLGVKGDAHSGSTVQHRSRVKKDPSQKNLRQVHLIHAELFEELNTAGFSIKPGQMGENITTKGIPLLDLPTGTLLHIGETELEITGLRNPCAQLNDIQEGLMNAVLDRDAEGNLIRKAGVMGIVLRGGYIKPGNAISITLPAEPHKSLEPV